MIALRPSFALFALVVTGLPAFAQTVQPSPGGAAGPPQAPSQEDYLRGRLATDLGFDTYQSRYANPRDLMVAAERLTAKHVLVGVPGAAGGIHPDRRDRMFSFGPAIGVQDFAAGRDELIELLAELDERMGQLQGAERAIEPAVSRLVELRSLQVGTAIALVGGMMAGVEVQALPETRSVVLRGSEQRVAEAAKLLGDADRPPAQFTLSCTLLTPTEGESDPSLPADLVSGLGELTGVSKFERLGSLLARGSVGSESGLGMTSEFPALGEAGERAATVTLNAFPSAYDPKTRTLSLERFTFSTQRPQEGSDKWSHSEISTNLTLAAGESTVVGALGSDQVFLVLRFVAH